MNAIVEKIPSSNSTKGNVLNNKNVSNNSKMLNESKKKSINTFILKINQSFNQNQMNKIDFKTFKRRFFIDYSFLLEKLKNNKEETNENNNNLNINNKENHLEMKRNILGRKKKRTESNVMDKEEKECLVTCKNGIIKILEDDSNTNPSSSEIKLNFQVKNFIIFLDIKKN